MKIANDVTELIGNTPLVRLNISATLKAVRHVYELLEDNPCDHCMQADFAGTDHPPLYYLV